MVGDILRKGAEVIGKTVAPGAVTGVKAVAGAGKAVAGWAAYAGLQDFFESIKDPGFSYELYVVKPGCSTRR